MYNKAVHDRLSYTVCITKCQLRTIQRILKTIVMVLILKVGFGAFEIAQLANRPGHGYLLHGQNGDGLDDHLPEDALHRQLEKDNCRG